MSFIAEIVGNILLSMVWWLLLFPIMWLLATPFILIWALFQPWPYWQAVRDMYGGVTEIWKQWGWTIVP